MKKCPKCGQTFAEENSFCLMDGTTLVLASEASQMQNSFSTDNDVPTQVISAPRTTTSTENRISTIPGWVYMIMGIMGTSVIALVAFIFLTQNDGNQSSTSLTNQNSEKKIEKPKENVKDESDKELNTKESYVVQIPDENQLKQSIVPEQEKEIKQEPTPENDSNFSPTGNWSGDWKSKSTDFVATANFNELSGKVQGQINWNLVRTTNSKKINKVGSSAREYVRGTFDRKTGKIVLRGYKKEDPQNIVILDRYNLILSKDSNQIKGRSINGSFILKR